MPAGITHSPRTFPLHNVFLGRFFPHGKIRGMTLFAVDFDACARLLLVELCARQFAVIHRLGNIEINTVACFVRKTFLHQFLNEIDHNLNVVRGFRRKFGLADIEFFQVLEKHAGVKLRNFVRTFLLLARGFLHFILAVVAVGKQMPYVGNVHNAFYFIPLVFKRTTEQIHKDVGTHVAYMRKAVYGRSARIHTNLIASVLGCKLLFFSGKRIIKLHNDLFTSFLFKTLQGLFYKADRGF